MDRKRRRDEEDDDFEDDRPRRRRGESGGGGTALWLGVGLGAGAVVLIGAVVLAVGSRRSAERERLAAEVAALTEREQALAAREAREARVRDPRPAPPVQIPPGNPGENWKKVIGTWQRTPGMPDPDYPYYFEFRPDRGVTMTRVGHDGQPRTDEARIEVQSDVGEHFSTQLHVHLGMYGYSFRLPPDGTLVLDGRWGDLVFRRVK